MRVSKLVRDVCMKRLRTLPRAGDMNVIERTEDLHEIEMDQESIPSQQSAVF